MASQSTKTIRAAVKQAYKLGLREGRAEQQKLFNCMQTTNSRLWKELRSLNEEAPLEGVLISFEFTESLIQALKSKSKHMDHARRLRKMLNAADRSLHDLLRVLESCKEFK